MGEVGESKRVVGGSYADIGKIPTSPTEVGKEVWGRGEATLYTLYTLYTLNTLHTSHTLHNLYITHRSEKGKLATAKGKREQVGARTWDRIPLGNQTARAVARTNETRQRFPGWTHPQPPMCCGKQLWGRGSDQTQSVAKCN